MLRRLDYLAGNITGLVYKTMLPMLLASGVNAVMQIVHIFFVGHINREVLYILSLYIPFSFFMIAVFEGIQLATQVAVARAKGEQDQKKVTFYMVYFLVIGIFLMGICGLLILLFSPFFAWFYGVPHETRSLFYGFITLMFIANLILIVNTVVGASLRGSGNVYTSSAISLLLAPVNIILLYGFIHYAQFHLYSVALANLLTGLLGSTLGIWQLCRKKELLLSALPWVAERREHGQESIRLFYNKMKQRKYVRFLLQVGLPVFLSYLIIFFSVFFFNKIVSYFGEAALAGFGVGYRIQTMVILPGILMGSALGILINQNLAQGQTTRVYKGFKVGLGNSFGLYLLIAVLLFLLREPLTSLLIADEASRQYASDYLKIVSPSYLLMGPLMTILILLEQIGKGYQALLLNMVYFGLIVLVGWTLALKYQSVTAFFWTVCSMNIAGLITTCIAIIWFRKKYRLTEQLEQYPTASP